MNPSRPCSNFQAQQDFLSLKVGAVSAEQHKSFSEYFSVFLFWGAKLNQMEEERGFKTLEYYCQCFIFKPTVIGHVRTHAAVTNINDEIMSN